MSRSSTRRVQACLRACRGFPTALLESGVLDELSRSPLGFAKVMDRLSSAGSAIVSVAQSLCTADPMASRRSA